MFVCCSKLIVVVRRCLQACYELPSQQNWLTPLPHLQVGQCFLTETLMAVRLNPWAMHALQTNTLVFAKRPTHKCLDAQKKQKRGRPSKSNKGHANALGNGMPWKGKYRSEWVWYRNKKKVVDVQVLYLIVWANLKLCTFWTMSVVWTICLIRLGNGC